MAKLEEEEEEEVEVGRSWDQTAKKEAHMYHPFLMYFSWPFGRVVHNSSRVTRIFWWDESYVVARPRTPLIGCLILIESS